MMNEEQRQKMLENAKKLTAKRNEMLKHANALRTFCKGHEGCKNCIFEVPASWVRKTCAFGQAPEYWRIPPVEVMTNDQDQ